MPRRTGYKGQLIIDSLRDLKRGDTVYVTYWSNKYVPVVVTRVKVVECAAIITVKKTKNMPYKRFVGYYTSKIATSGRECVLTIDTYWGDAIKESLEKAEQRSKVIIKRAEALKAMMTLKEWLFFQEDEYYDKEVE